MAHRNETRIKNEIEFRTSISIKSIHELIGDTAEHITIVTEDTNSGFYGFFRRFYIETSTML